MPAVPYDPSEDEENRSLPDIDEIIDRILHHGTGDRTEEGGTRGAE